MSETSSDSNSGDDSGVDNDLLPENYKERNDVMDANR